MADEAISRRFAPPLAARLAPSRAGGGEPSHELEPRAAYGVSPDAIVAGAFDGGRLVDVELAQLEPVALSF